MKNKLIKCTVLLAAALLLSVSVSGCGQDENVPPAEVPAAVMTSEVTAELPVETEISAETETETTEKSGEEFDFVSTLESTYICGHQLSYPLTWGQFEDDFEIVMESWDSQFGKSLFYVMYNGNKIGQFMIFDCENIDMLHSDSKVAMIIMNSGDDIGDIPLFSVKGYTFDNKRSELYDVLDEKYDNSVIKSMVNYHRTGYGRFVFSYDLMDEEVLQTFQIGLVNN